jgi:hypothetical protein
MNWKRWPFTAWRYIPLPGKYILTRCFTVGLARFELATLDPQIGPPRVSSLNYASLASMVHR